MNATISTVKITTKIVVEYHSEPIYNNPQPRTYRTWTTDDMAHWCGYLEMPMRAPDGEYVGASSTDECEKCEKFLLDLFALHEDRLPDGCNYSGTMEHTIDVSNVPAMLAIT